MIIYWYVTKGSRKKTFRSFFSGLATKKTKKKYCFFLTFLKFCFQSKIKHISFKGVFMGGGWYLWLRRFKMTSKYGSFSQKILGKFVVVVKISFRLFKKRPIYCGFPNFLHTVAYSLFKYGSIFNDHPKIYLYLYISFVILLCAAYEQFVLV